MQAERVVAEVVGEAEEVVEPSWVALDLALQQKKETRGVTAEAAQEVVHRRRHSLGMMIGQ